MSGASKAWSPFARRAAALGLAVGALLGTRAPAAEAPEVASGAAVVRALEEGAPTRAIAMAEALADRGHESSELAYHRGLAYARRIAGPDEATGDGGQAIAAFLEARALGARGDVDARVEAGLRSVRSHLARKRSAAGLSPVVEPSPGLVRAATLALPTWGWLALAFAVALAGLGAAVSAWRAPKEERGGRVAAAALLGALTLVFSGVSFAADRTRAREAVAVVVVPQAPLFDASTGALAEEEAMPEGLALRVVASDGSFLALADAPARSLRRDQVRVLQSQR